MLMYLVTPITNGFNIQAPDSNIVVIFIDQNL